MRRRRGLTQSDIRAIGALVSVAIAVVVLAAIGVYLLVAAAAVVVGWLIKVGAAAYARHQAERDRMVQVQESAPAYVPFAQADGTRDELLRIAPSAFDRWIRQFPFAPGDTKPLIREIAYREHRFARLTSEYEARRIVHRFGPCSGRHPAGAVRGRISEFDAWSISDDDLRARTIRAEACGECSGRGRSTCVACSGHGRSTCRACEGAGKAYGYAKNNAYRLLNCKACRGRGSLDCACVVGRVSCRT